MRLYLTDHLNKPSLTSLAKLPTEITTVNMAKLQLQLLTPYN